MPYSSKDQSWIQSQPKPSLIGREIIIHDCVKSTNDLAKDMAIDWDREGTVILADSQTHGKGRLGRSWHSDKNVGIYLSTLVKPSLPPEQVPQIALVAGIAAVQAINEFSPAQAFLKWPNDILINGKKVAGILAENYSDDELSAIILGIGINVNNARFPIDIQHIATSIAMENGGSFDRLPLIPALLTHLDREYRSFLDNGIAPVIQQWSMNSDMFGMEVSLTQGDRAYSGTAERLNEQGQLVILLDSGEARAFDSGEVTLQG